MRNSIMNILSFVFKTINGSNHIPKSKLKQRIMDETADIGFANITHDWEKAKRLQEELRKKCHPDKFPDELVEKATEIFQAVGKSRYNYNELQELKAIAEKELKITITN